MKLVKNLEIVESIFGDWDEIIIWSCVQGIMGEVFVDSLDQPKSSLAKLGRKSSFGFLAGQPTLFLLEVCSGEDIILVPQHKGWSDLIESTYGQNAHSFKRYATKKDTLFERSRLEKFVTQLPNGFELRVIDEKVYNSCLEKEWSQDLVANYATYQYYKKQGIGYVIYYQGNIIAGASSYSTYKNGIEIEVDTHPDFRRRGLATIVAAQLILTCLDKGIYPSWDAHTRTSLNLSEKLGYEFSHEYIAYEID
ncbi:TPA: GNAT family N-acetyltransferase [Streptococcus agalactiae]